MLEQIFEHSKKCIRIKKEDYRRYIYDINHCKNRMSIFIGSRGIGKTTLLLQYVWEKNKKNLDNTNAVYIQVDHFHISKYSIYEMAEQLSNHGTTLLCLDEIHKYPNWSQELKSIYDSFPDLHVIASGSAALEISKGSHDLSRRAIVYRMNEVSFREYLEMTLDIKLPKIGLKEVLKNSTSSVIDILNKVEEKNKKILSLFTTYLKVGNYPYFNEIKNQDLFHETLEQQIHTVIESDILSIHSNLSGAIANKIKLLLKVLAESVPFTPNLKRLKESLGIADERTLKFYLKLLEDAGLIRTLTKSGIGLKQLEFPEKIYLANPNLTFALKRISPNIGSLRETFMMMSLRNQGPVFLPKEGDFKLEDGVILEVGGKNKSFKQIKESQKSYLALDDIEVGEERKIPLWRFGFLY